MQGLVVYDDELKKWFVADEDNPLFANVPGLRGTVRSLAASANQSKTQGARSADRKRKYEKRKVARARAYRKRRDDPTYREMSNSDLKAWCGQRLVRDPTSEGTYLPTLQRRQSINAIDEGLALIATGRYVLSSRYNAQDL
jgi:hypothetical protein